MEKEVINEVIKYALPPGKILLQRVEQTVGKILLAQQHKEARARIVAVGANRISEHGVEIPTDARNHIGKDVLTVRGFPLTIEGKPYILANDADILIYMDPDTSFTTLVSDNT